MPKEIKFNIKLTIDGKESLVTASTNVKALAKEFGLAHAEAKKFQSGISKWSA